MPKISNKGQTLPSSPIRKLVVHADQAKSRGIEVLHLNIGQPDIEAPQEAMDMVRDHELTLLPYGSSQGALSYRTHLCSYYGQHGITIDPDDIIVTTGAARRCLLPSMLFVTQEMKSLSLNLFMLITMVLPPLLV